MKNSSSGRVRQQGIAAILMLVLVGSSLTATMFGSAHYLRSSQEQHLALHAQTVAQARAWTAAEAVRMYLESVAADGDWAEFTSQLEAEGLSESVDMELTDVTAQIIGLDLDMSPPRLTALLVGKAGRGSRAESTSTIRVVYAIELPTAGSNEENNGVVHFNRDLKLRGSINVKAEPGKQYELNVKGNLIANGGNSITGISIIRATESIEIGGGSSFDELHTNGDIKLTGSVSGQNNLQARGNICLGGGASVMGQVKANGSVIGSGGAGFGDVSSIGQSDNFGLQLCVPPALALDASGRPFGVDLQGNSSARSVISKASVRVNSGSVESILGERDLVDTNWGGTIAGQIGGELVLTHSNPDILKSVKIVPGLVVSVAPVPVLSFETVAFNTYDLRQYANYSFTVDSGGYKVVTVKNVNGVSDGDYYLGNYSSGPNHLDRLCVALAANSSPSNPVCAAPPKEQSVPVCSGQSEWNKCFDYKDGTWTIDGKSMAQGVVWFEGDLNLKSGNYFNTFIATGDIQTSGSHQTTAPNYAGFSKRNDLAHGMCADLVFPGYYPTQLCQAGNYNYDADGGLGNYALMAGSCEPNYSVSCRYVGGNITTGGSSVIRGAIKAGNEFVSGGSTTTRGYISALGLGAQRTNSSMGGSTQIDLTDLPSGYDPSGGAGDGGGGGSVGDGDDESGSGRARILWSRYL